MNKKVVRLPEVQAMTGLSRRTIYNYVMQGSFPKPFKLGHRINGWWASDVTSWLEKQAHGRIAA